ncbi:MAG TPA: hypothetical protein VIJ12_11005 [Candidatus Baltobacteraceae bacterium]
MKRICSLLVAASFLATAGPAMAWGSKGHTMINKVGATLFPASMPAFLHSTSAIAEIATLGPEEDRLKGAGGSWDADNDPGHFLDIGDDDTVGGVVRLDSLPLSLDAYDAALRAVNNDPYKEGYVPYEILDGWDQIREDFAYWRVDNYGATHAATPAQRGYFVTDRTLRQTLTLRDIGVWGHFVADASQPLHITIHFNGWGNYPNPSGYTQAHIHSMFESQFVNRVSNDADVTKLVPAYVPTDPTDLLTQRQMLSMIGKYLSDSAAAVDPLYDLDKAGAFDAATPQAVTFVDTQLAHGAGEFRNLTALAWEDSLNDGVGYPTVKVRDIITGKTPFTFKAFGDD